MPQVVERIEAYNQGRNAQLLKKYHLMRDTPFAFFRGTCHLFYDDWPQDSSLNDAPAAWVVGDLHPQNFAVYRGDDNQIYFDINDFDDSLLAPCTWDVTRLLTSFYVIYPATTAQNAAQQCLAAYISALVTGHPRSVQLATAAPTVHSWMLERSERKPKKLLNKYSTKSKRTRKLKTLQDETYPLTDAEKDRAIKLITRWSKSRADAERYQVRDVMGRNGGISSVGLERYLFLVEGDGSPDNNWLVEVKQRIHPASLPYVSLHQPKWKNAATRVAILQHRLQAIPPTSLDVLTSRNASYTLRSFEPVQAKVPIERFEKMPARQELVETLGKVSAWAHLRGARHQGSASADELVAFVAQAGWQRDVLKYATDYAKRVASDFKTFKKSDLGEAI